MAHLGQNVLEVRYNSWGICSSMRTATLQERHNITQLKTPKFRLFANICCMLPSRDGKASQAITWGLWQKSLKLKDKYSTVSPVTLYKSRQVQWTGRVFGTFAISDQLAALKSPSSVPVYKIWKFYGVLQHWTIWKRDLEGKFNNLRHQPHILSSTAHYRRS